VPGAIRYHVQVASDQDTQNILAENTSANSTVTVNPLANGNYYVRVSAIDKAGLEGFPQTHAFTLMARAESSAGKAPGASSAPFVDQSNASEITLKWLPQPGKKFLLQVARDAEFSWLLFKTDTPRAEAHLPRPAFGTYYARVKSVNSDGSDNAFSPVQAFIVTDQWVINDGSPVGGQQTVPSATR
jgi:hypothetical protein